MSRREATRDDVPEMVDLFSESLADLYQRTGTEASLPPRSHMLSLYGHVQRTGIFRVALVHGRMEGIAGAVVRGDTWYLSAYWVRPLSQKMHIGMPLLREVWGEGRQAGAKAFCVWSSQDPPALASYMKLGMFPAYDVFRFTGTAVIPVAARGYAVRPLETGVAEGIDRLVRRTSRGVDHEYWRQLDGPRGHQLVRGREAVGYFYVNDGMIGPAGWQDPSDAGPLLFAAIREAASSSGEVALSIPGPNVDALRIALESGLLLGGFAQLLASDVVGIPSQYLPSGAGLY